MDKADKKQVFGGLSCPKGMLENSFRVVAARARKKSKRNPVKIYTKQEIAEFQAKRDKGLI